MLRVTANVPPVVTEPAMGTCKDPAASLALSDGTAIAAVASSSSAIGIEALKCRCLVIDVSPLRRRAAGRPGRFVGSAVRRTLGHATDAARGSRLNFHRRDGSPAWRAHELEEGVTRSADSSLAIVRGGGSADP